MTLTTEEYGDIPDISSTAIDDVLMSDAFGKFAILARSETEFLQIGNDWSPDEACSTFLQTHGSDPWVIEYRENDQQYRANGQVTLAQAQRAFHSYLEGAEGWRTMFTWSLILV